MHRESFLAVVVLVILLAGPRSAMGQLPCTASEVDVVFQDEPVTAPGHQTSELFANAIDSLIVKVPREEPARTKVHVAIVSRIPDNEGVQSWSLSALSTGDVLVAEATTEGTAADDAPEGLSRGGFKVTEAGRHRFKNNGCGGGDSGFTTAVVFSFTELVALEPEGTATILSVTLVAKSSPGAAPMTGQISWFDPGCPCAYDVIDDDGAGHGACGQPAISYVIVRGQTQRPCDHPVTVTFLEKPLSPFLRGDANTDGRVDISDAVRIVMYLFLGATEPSCADTADTNDSGGVDLTDCLVILNDFFRPGTGIPAPGPFECGSDPTVDGLNCESYPPCD